MIIKVFDLLSANGIDTYFIGQHKGDCLRKYVVLKDDGTISDNGINGTSYIDIIFFVPENEFMKCNDFKKQVISILKDCKSIKYTGSETSIITDNDKKALTFSVMYEVKRKLV